MFRSKFLIRIDDIQPQMNSNNFQRLIDCMTKYNIKGIIGVIPDNKDSRLVREKLDPHFWERIKKLQMTGHLIAQHGFQHLYDTKQGGILCVNSKSEFAGHSYEIQKEKMLAGKKIMQQKGLQPNLFMAPSHSFDHITLNVVKELSYGITDGFGLWPRYKKGILSIPQLFASPLHFGIGVYTICLHTDSMKEEDFLRIEQYLEENSKYFISPNQLEQYTLKKHQYFYVLIDILAGFLLKILLKIKRLSFS